MHPKSFVGRAPPGPAGGSLQRSPYPLAESKGPTSKEGDGRGGKGREGKEGKGREGARACPLHIISGYATDGYTY